MGRSEHSLVPQWLKSGNVSSGASINNQLESSSHSDQITHSGFEWSSTSKGAKHSRSYSSSVGSRCDSDWENDNYFDHGKLVLGGRKHHDKSGSLDIILSKRFDKNLLQRSQSKTSGSGRWGETWSGRIAGDLSSPITSHGKSGAIVAEGVSGSMYDSVFEEEFPLLGAEDNQGYSHLGKVIASGPSPSYHSLLNSTSAVNVSNGLASASHEIPVTAGSSSIATVLHRHTVSVSSSSVAPGMMGLSMAETLAQGPPRPQTPPQSTVGTQKLEELAIKQSRLLIPMTPSMPRGLVSSPSEKLKIKTGPQQQHPFSSSRPSNYSPRGGLARSDVSKTTSGNFRIVSASGELNGVSSAQKDSLSPIGASTATTINAPSRNSNNYTNPAVWTTLEKRSTSQSQSRSDFFRNLSRKSFSKNPCSDHFPTEPCASEKSEEVTGNVTASLALQSGDASSLDTSVVDLLTECSCVITDSGDSACESLKISSNGAQHLNNSSILYPDEEEAAFLRSLGWEESTEEDEGLTEEEIRDFCEKYMKLQPSSNILRKMNLKMLALPLDLSSGSCGPVVELHQN